MDHHHNPQDNRDDTNRGSLDTPIATNDTHDDASRDHQNTPNTTNDNHDEQPNIQTETFVFSGNGGAAFFATMQSILTRIVGGQPFVQPQPQAQSQQPGAQESTLSTVGDTDMPPLIAVTDLPSSLSESSSSLTPSENASSSTATDNSFSSNDTPNAGPPPGSRPIRPLPRPHAHIHAHTPGGVIDLFTFNLGDLPPPQAPAAASFTFNLGPDIFAGFENFFLNGGFHLKDPEPDFDRAKTLLRGMEVVPEGLVKRLERAGGVPGAQDAEEHAGCAVCYGPLLEDVEPGEWDNAQQKEAREKAKDDDAMNIDEDEFHGRIVALPCAHVYHAECLLPWFARNTTCPTCRFDIDPDSLTWKPQPLRPPPSETDVGFNSNMNSENTSTDADEMREANVTDAARFNAFMDAVFRIPTHRPTASDGQPQPQMPPAAQATPSSPPAAASSPLETQPRPLEPLIFGPAPPPPPPPPVHAIPAIFRMPMPLFIVPNAQTGQNQQQQQQQSVQPEPHPQQGERQASRSIPSQLPLPPLPQQHQQSQWQPHPPQPEAFIPIPLPIPIPVPHHVPFHLPRRPSQAPPQPRRKWVAPDPVGKTLRQRVETKERELGLRCDDPVCGLAPEDDDLEDSKPGETRRVKLRAAYNPQGKACEHEFHPECLVRSTRVSATRDSRPILFEDGTGAEEDIPVQCSVCRAEGWLWKEEWAEGCQPVDECRVERDL